MRKTKIRTDLLILFNNSKRPVQASELLKLLSKKHPSVNKTTVYRELTFLVTQKIIREVYWNDSIVRYEKESDRCHHHLVCEHCGCVEDISFDETKLLSVVGKKSGFEIKKHSVEFFGLCINCHS